MVPAAAAAASGPKVGELSVRPLGAAGAAAVLSEFMAIHPRVRPGGSESVAE